MVIKTVHGTVLFRAAPETQTIRQAVEAAVAAGVSLRLADLRLANLRGVDLRGSDLREADLRGADLRETNLRGSDLRGSDLRRADLSGSDLRGSDLRDADLRRADLSGASMSGAGRVPVVPSLHRRILAAIEAGGKLSMRKWHKCETTHCRAGWAIYLAGAEGARLERSFGPSVAGALITVASCPALEGRVPNFYANNEDALAEITRLAKMEPPIESE